MKIRLFRDGEALDFEVGGSGTHRDVGFAVDGKTVRHEIATIATTPQGGSLLVDGRPVRYLAHRERNRLRIAVHGETFDFDLAEAKSGRRSHATANPETRSPMPGKVLQLSAEVGQAVKPGDPLLILEAMKMENVLAAEIAGKVAAVHVRVGDMVEPGKLLVVVTPDPES
jgi:acetyl-CoA/propionyl-CoA carboxylase, biotin carboxylase, biotin carboxyl carrier protein